MAASTTRADLHALIDVLPDDVLAAARAALEPFAPPPFDPDSLEEDDEPLTPEEEAMLAASQRDMANGDYITDKEMDAFLADIGG